MHHNAPRVLVEAGTLNYHITRIDPVQPEAIGVNILNGLKVEVLTGLVAQNRIGSFVIEIS